MSFSKIIKVILISICTICLTAVNLYAKNPLLSLEECLSKPELPKNLKHISFYKEKYICKATILETLKKWNTQIKEFNNEANNIDNRRVVDKSNPLNLNFYVNAVLNINYMIQFIKLHAGVTPPNKKIRKFLNKKISYCTLDKSISDMTWDDFIDAFNTNFLIINLSTIKSDDMMFKNKTNHNLDVTWNSFINTFSTNLLLINSSTVKNTNICSHITPGINQHLEKSKTAKNI